MLERWAADSGADVTVVFEKPPSPPIRSTVIDVAHAPRPRRDSADDEIVRLLRADAEPAAVRVVTSDRWLADRAYARRRERRAGGRLPVPDRRRLMPPDNPLRRAAATRSIAYQVTGEGTARRAVPARLDLADRAPVGGAGDAPLPRAPRRRSAG